MYRDFSEKSKRKLLGIVDSVENEKWSNFTDWIGDRNLDFVSWIGLLNINQYLNNVSAYHKKVIDKNNTTKETIEAIFSKVNGVDTSYRTKVIRLNSQLQSLDRYVVGLERTINPSQGTFTSTFVSSSMGKLWEEYSTLVTNLNTSSGVYLQPIINGFDPTQDLFFANRNMAIDAVAIGFSSDWIANIFSFTGLTTSTRDKYVRESIESLIKSTLINKHELSDFYDDFTKNYSIDELEKGKKVIKLFNKSAKIYTEDEIAKLIDLPLEELQDSEYLKSLIMNQEMVQSVTDNLDIADSISNAVDIIDVSNQILSKLLSDYTEDIKYLEAIKQALIDGGYDNKTVEEVVNTMIWEYKNQYLSAAVDAGYKDAYVKYSGEHK